MHQFVQTITTMRTKPKFHANSLIEKNFAYKIWLINIELDSMHWHLVVCLFHWCMRVCVCLFVSASLTRWINIFKLDIEICALTKPNLVRPEIEFVFITLVYFFLDYRNRFDFGVQCQHFEISNMSQICLQTMWTIWEWPSGSVVQNG